MKRGFVLDKNREDAEQKPLSMTHCMKRGFTFIELLVVVLIIGILSAVALPQYQVAVMKARLAATMPAVATLKTAAELYYLENGFYDQYDMSLAIDSIGGCRTNYNSGDVDIFWCGNFFINYIGGGGRGANNIMAGVGENPSSSNPTELQYVAYLDHSSYPNRRECLAYKENEVANKVCKSMGGVPDGTDSTALSWARTPVNVYVLP